MLPKSSHTYRGVVGVCSHYFLQEIIPRLFQLALDIFLFLAFNLYLITLYFFLLTSTLHTRTYTLLPSPPPPPPPLLPTAIPLPL